MRWMGELGKFLLLFRLITLTLTFIICTTRKIGVGVRGEVRVGIVKEMGVEVEAGKLYRD